MLVHRCDDCYSNTAVEYSATVWSQSHTCSHVSCPNILHEATYPDKSTQCGLDSPGVDIGGSTDGQMNHGQHDELAQLFAQNMQLSHQQNGSRGQVVEQVPQQTSEKQAESPIHYISTHYTPTAHLRPDTTSEPSPSPPPPYNATAIPQALAETLLQHSIDPSALLPSQINLFHHADYEQRLRLLELWRISPPSYPLEDHIRHGWTSFEHEEAQAKQRYEQHALPRGSHQEEHMLDTYVPINPIREAGEAAWPPAARMRVASITAASRAASRGEDAEPYIINGYQSNPMARATDPVYAAVSLWQASPNDTIGDQFGMSEQIRSHAAPQNFVGFHGPAGHGMDEDMVM